MMKDKINIDTRPLHQAYKEAFPDPNPLNLNKEQLTQMYKNMCKYLGVNYNEPKELEGVKKIVKDLRNRVNTIPSELKQYPLTPDECYNPDNLDKGIFVKTPLTNNWAKDSNNEQEK